MIRILRLIEYVYEDNELAEEDMAHWWLPPNGIKAVGNKTIRSTILTDLNYGDDDDGH